MNTGMSEVVLQYFYASCILLVPVFCGLERTCTPDVKAHGRRGTCGSQLTQLISVACMFRGYNTGGKRSGAPIEHLKPDSITAISARANAYVKTNANTKANTTMPKVLDSFRQQLKAQLVSKRQAVSFLVKKAAYDEQGIVCECCYYQCSFREIIDYCGGGDDDAGFFKRSQPSGKASDVKRESYSDDFGQPLYSDKDEMHYPAH